MLCICMLLSLSACTLFCSHEWVNATCTTPKTCSLCGVTEGQPAPHQWKAATCTTPKTCSLCRITEGHAASHKWQDATCTSPRTCSTCDGTSGSPLGHNYSNGYCSRCNAAEPIKTIDRDDVLTEKPNYLWFSMNSAGGIKFGWEHNYKGSKKINYIHITFKLYDAVGNPITDDIKHQSVHSFRLIGPFNVGEPISFHSDVLFYCDACSKVTITKLIFEYADGTKAQFDYGWSNTIG